jgi:hypothetical protein
MTKADEANRILAEYPDGWTSIKTASDFHSEISYLYTPDSDDEVCSEEKSLSKEELEEANQLAEKSIYTIYERTRKRLNDKNDNFLISCLCYGIDSENLGLREIRRKMLDHFLSSRTYQDKNKFLRNALWEVQRDAMHNSVGGKTDDNFHYGLLYRCINLSASEDEAFILEEIIPEMEKCGRKSMIPSKYKKREPWR